MSKKTIQLIEPNIADLANGWLKSYKLVIKYVVLYADKKIAGTKEVAENEC